MSITDLFTTTFLIFTFIIAILPLFFKINNNRTAKLWYKIGWIIWVVFWGSLAFTTSAQLQYGVPQRLRFPILFILPVILGTLMILKVSKIRNFVNTITLESLVKWQICRVVGGFFLVGAFFGIVSIPFAIISGIGDISVGIAAFFALGRMKQFPNNAISIAKKHAWFGLADFALAVTVALLTQAQIGFPYALIPLFLVPIAILGHVATLARKL